MQFISAPGTYVPISGCDVPRIAASGAGGITSTVVAGRLARLRTCTSTGAVEVDRSAPDLPRVAMRSSVPDYGDAGTVGVGMTPTAGTGVENLCATANAAVRRAQSRGRFKAVSAVTNSEGPADGE